MIERLYSPQELEAAYAGHVIVEVEALGGLFSITRDDGTRTDISIEHDERLSASRGTVRAVGRQALNVLVRAHVQGSYGYDGSALMPAEVVFEPHADRSVVPARWSTTGRPLVVLAVGDVLGIIAYTPE